MIKKDIIIFGMQGAGKGTQAELMQQYLPNHKYLEMGKIMRALKSSENMLGRYIQDRIDHGKLVPDSVTIELFKACFNTLEDGEFLLIDGFPRKLHQMHAFMETMLNNNRDFVVVYFDLTEEVAVKRLLQRGREDDTENGIRTRIDGYLLETMPVINYFENTGKLMRINADDTVENISAKVKSSFESL